jgi:predicted RNA-binding Zn ribbon-like protein
MTRMAQIVHAPGEEGSLALALVNSLHASRIGPVDHLGDGDALRAWAAERAGMELAASDGDVGRFRELRRAVREALAAAADECRPAAGALEAINAAAACAPGAPALACGDDGALRAEWRPAGGKALDRLAAAIAADAIDLVTGARREALIACHAPGCVRLLLRDHNRRRWCSTACGDRVRAARYYARHKAD